MFSITNPEKRQRQSTKAVPQTYPWIRHPFNIPHIDLSLWTPSTSRDLSFGLVPDNAVRCPSDTEVPLPLYPDNNLFINVDCKTENWLFLKPSFWTHSRTGFYSSIPCDWQRFNRLRC